MDAGCALGGALRLFSEIYPLASLYGIDFSENAINICEKEYGKFAISLLAISETLKVFMI